MNYDKIDITTFEDNSRGYEVEMDNRTGLVRHRLVAGKAATSWRLGEPAYRAKPNNEIVIEADD